MRTTFQPLLHDLLPTVAAPTQLWTDRVGQVLGRGAQGLFHGDTRALSRLEVLVDGLAPENVSVGPLGTGRSEVVDVVRTIDGPNDDPTTSLRRTVTVTPGRLEIEFLLACSTPEPVSGRLEVVLASDLASLDAVKQGRATQVAPGRIDGERVDFGGAGTDGAGTDGTGTDGADSDAAGMRVQVEAAGARLSQGAGGAVVVSWDVTAATGEPARRVLRVDVVDPRAVVLAPRSAEAEWAEPALTSDDQRLPRLLRRSLADLASLRLSWERTPDDVFLAAGAPWFFTLFGRDSLWAARLLLPLGTDLARGTLRTLAAGQGEGVVPGTAEQPGKILHEVRAAALNLSGETALPPVYYGTVDATPLWICLLHDAWRWGMADDDVAELLPHLERALEWLVEHGDGDGDGFLDYIDATGAGLSNQGWKDSGDSIQWRDGSLAAGPIALSEVQAYAYEAAVGGAALLEAFGRDGAPALREWAAALATRFREKFWTSDDDGPYLGIALDRDGRLVDSVASNMGHVVGTGILSEQEELLVARRLVSAEMSSGYGLRTLSDRMGGYWSLGYHRGTVWAHDTAIAVVGLSRAGLDEQAAELVRGLLAAAEEVGYQLPELYGGAAADATAALVPYPSSCHPQAWSAASAVAIVQAVLGLAPGVDGVPTVRAVAPAPVGAFALDGIVQGGRRWRVSAARGGVPEVAPS